MTTYFVDSARADDTGDGLSWAAAKKTIQAALTAASSGTDIVVIKSTVDHLVSADTTWTTTNDVKIIAATADDTGTAYTPTVMGETNCIGHRTTSYSLTFNGGADDKVFMWGLTFRVAGATTKNINACGNTTGLDVRAEQCLYWESGTGTGQIICATAGGTGSYTSCTFKFAAAGQTITTAGAGKTQFLNCTFSGTALTLLLQGSGGVNLFTGCDLSAMSGTLVGNLTVNSDTRFIQCKLHASATILAVQTGNPTAGSANVFVHDCSSGDTHGLFGYYDAFGSAVSDTGVYFTSGAAGQAWLITTSANASVSHPFTTPWIDLYHTGTSAITPYFEILRNNDSTTAYDNDEVWAEFLAKTTTGSTLSTLYSDKMAVGGSPAAQANGAGTGSWTGETGLCWSGKVDSGSALTPAESGHIRGRVCVGLASIAGKLLVNPQILTL